MGGRVAVGAWTFVIAMVPLFAIGQELPADHAKKMAQGTELFRQEVRTVLRGRCVKCHGGESTEGEFSLATREDLLKGGESGAAIQLTKPAKQSLLVRLIRHETEPVMPEDGAKLDDRQIAAIEQWIELGAPYDKPLVSGEDADPTAWTRRTIDDSAREFWSFRPLAEQAVPELKDDSWSRTAVDRWVLANARQNGLQPNSDADRRTLIRRAYFDLIGLPPSPGDVQAFLQDDDPMAYEKLVDRLLESRHHGERVARHWMDIARFAESHGFEQDYDRPHAFHYRDFLIKAFNADMPYDQFVRFQIAGDELEPSNPLAMMATGFLGAGVFPTQLTEKEFESSRYDELDDMVSTMGTAMLGITIGCARCHDHKFDPIPARDYYQLVSAFRTAIRSNVELELDQQETKAKLEQWQAGIQPLRDALAEYEAEHLPGKFGEYLEHLRRNPPDKKVGSSEAPWITLSATHLSSEANAEFGRQPDGSYLVSGPNAVSDTYTFVTETTLTDLSGVRLEALADESMNRNGPGRASNGNFGLSKISVFMEPLRADSKRKEVALIDPQVTFEQNTTNLSIKASLDTNPQTGWAVDPKFGQNHAASFRFAESVGGADGSRLVVQLQFNVNRQHNMGRIRIAVCRGDERPELNAPATAQESAQLLAMNLSGGKPLSMQQKSALLSGFKNADPKWREHNDRLQKYLASKPKPKLTKVMITSEGVKPIPNHGDGRGFPHFYKDAFFLNRGDVNQKQGVANTGYLQVLTHRQAKPTEWSVQPGEDAKTSFRRVAVANWLTDTQRGAGTLLARVIVNRLWQQHLGRGIVATPNDFGFQGQRPSHPALLDWLAAELIRNDWRLKPIRRLIMTSSVYRQSSHWDESKASVDPDNQRFWRYSPRRLEAEIIRDSLLAVSGMLDPTQFGPGTLDERMRRRSIYFFIKRSRLIPFLQVFDSPEPLASVGSRPSTTIAPQALVFLNNSQVREYSKAFAKRCNGTDDRAFVQQAYWVALARKPSESELSQSVDFIQQQRLSYEGESRRDAGDLARADLCQVILSLNEFVYIN